MYCSLLYQNLNITWQITFFLFIITYLFDKVFVNTNHFLFRSIQSKSWMPGSLCESVKTLESLHLGCLCLVTMATLWILHWGQDSKQEIFICYHLRFVIRMELKTCRLVDTKNISISLQYITPRKYLASNHNTAW